MNKYTSGIHISVRNEDVWKKLEKLDVKSYGLCSKSFASMKGLKYVVQNDWSICEEDLLKLVKQIIELVNKDDLIIMSFTHKNVGERYVYNVYYFGEQIYEDTYSEYDYDDLSGDWTEEYEEGERLLNNLYYASLYDLGNYINAYNQISNCIIDSEIKVLGKFGIKL